jgi:nucleoside-diphosphate-sugar epimerase
VAEINAPTFIPSEYEIVPLANDILDKELSVLEIARLVCSLLGSELRTAEFPLPQDDPARRCPDLARAREMITWRPETPLREGLARTIAWYRENQYVFV